MTENFYRAFEDRYRGSRETIKERLRAYLPFIAPFALEKEKPVALDLGCGRGEWLELLGEHAFAARGVDLDDGMLTACREHGLSVETADAIASLQALPDSSVAVVSAFHLVEHIPFDALRELVAQALRVLQPGGLLIMETPNPENPMVGACRFYLDPSHLRPIPPNLLSFLTEYAGFARQKVVRLQENPVLHTAAAIHLINVIDGASPDYSVVAQKAGPAEVLAQFDASFEHKFGIGVDELAQRFEADQQTAAHEFVRGAIGVQEQQVAEVHSKLADTHASVTHLKESVGHLEASVLHVGTSVSSLETMLAGTNAALAAANAKTVELTSAMAGSDLRLAQCEAKLAEASLRITEVHAQLTIDRAQQEVKGNTFTSELAELRSHLDETKSRLVLKEHELAEVRTHLQAVFSSTSWRVTAPLRWLGSLFRPRR